MTDKDRMILDDIMHAIETNLMNHYRIHQESMDQDLRNVIKSLLYPLNYGATKYKGEWK